jgi:hypothetical protein
MALRFAFLLLLSVFSYGMAIPAFPVHDIPMQKPHSAPECPANEHFESCGSACAPTCAHPEVSSICTKNCVVGCFCNDGYLRNAQGVCVQTRSCDGAQHQMLFAYPPELSQCKENEIFLTCGSACPQTCSEPHPGMCTMQCVVGCFCKPGFLKADNGACVAAENCGARAEDAMPIQPRVCGQNEEFRQCKGCDGTCKNPNPLCPRICIPGCACKRGFLRSEEGKCIETRECSAQQVQPESFMMMPPFPPVCPSDEVFKPCGTACPATCANPHPSPVCTRNCVIGCFCKEGYLRNEKGVCVAAANCDAPTLMNTVVLAQVEGKCATDREFYTDCGSQLDCLATCGTPPPFLIRGVPQIPPKCADLKCSPSCVCKRPYVRNASGVCVERSECEHKNPFATTPSH